MNHLILGYGYCGYYIAQELIKKGRPVQVVSRHSDTEYELPHVPHHIQDISQPLPELEENTCLYYLIPPPQEGETDTLLKHFLHDHDLHKIKKVIYFSSSGVYGNHRGALIDEHATCLIQHPRQLRRLDAEQRWAQYCAQKGIELNILRVGGIFGPKRLPLDAAKNQTPVIEAAFAPYINHIYVRDLARIAAFLASIKTQHLVFNTADNHPRPMGTLQQTLAHILGIAPAPYESWDIAWSKASPMKQEFMLGSKRLIIDRLKGYLPSSLAFTSLEEAIKESL